MTNVRSVSHTYAPPAGNAPYAWPSTRHAAAPDCAMLASTNGLRDLSRGWGGQLECQCHGHYDDRAAGEAVGAEKCKVFLRPSCTELGGLVISRRCSKGSSGSGVLWGAHRDGASRPSGAVQSRSCIYR